MPRAEKGSSPLAEVVRVGHVYLDTATRQLRILNETGRELHRDGIVFAPGDIKDGTWQRADGVPVQASDLPLLRAWRENAPQEAIFLRTREGGRVDQVRWTASPVADGGGKVVGVVGTVMVDPPAVDWLHLGGLAHDLRTPLQTLQLTAALLETTVATGGNVAALVPRVGSATERALAIARDLLEWCKAPFQKRKRDRATFGLEPFLLTLVEEHGMTAQKKGLTLVSSCDEVRGWEISVDRVGFGRLLSNLLANAIRYTTNGRVELTARWRDTEPTRDAADPLGSGTKLIRSSLVVSVVDTGVGISAEEQESIFQPFERGRGGRQDPESGSSGLGLAVVDRLVEDLGLTLEVYSIFGQGSAFDVVIPTRMLRREDVVA